MQQKSSEIVCFAGFSYLKCDYKVIPTQFMPGYLVMPGTADVLPVTVTGSYAKLGHFWLRQFPHSGYVPVTAEAEQAYQVEHYPLCGASPFHCECLGRRGAVMAVPAMTCLLP